jgi:hypothetical protein
LVRNGGEDWISNAESRTPLGNCGESLIIVAGENEVYLQASLSKVALLDRDIERKVD